VIINKIKTIEKIVKWRQGQLQWCIG
jgi:hypothetical protein